MEYEFQQRVFAVSESIKDPDIFWKLFYPEERQLEDNVFFPASQEEFDEVLRIFEEEDRLNDLGETQASLA